MQNPTTLPKDGLRPSACAVIMIRRHPEDPPPPHDAPAGGRVVRLQRIPVTAELRRAA